MTGVGIHSLAPDRWRSSRLGGEALQAGRWGAQETLEGVGVDKRASRRVWLAPNLGGEGRAMLSLPALSGWTMPLAI